MFESAKQSGQTGPIVREKHFDTLVKKGFSLRIKAKRIEENVSGKPHRIVGLLGSFKRSVPYATGTFGLTQEKLAEHSQCTIPKRIRCQSRPLRRIVGDLFKPLEARPV